MGCTNKKALNDFVKLMFGLSVELSFGTLVFSRSLV